VQQLDQRPAVQAGGVVRLREPAGDDAAPEPGDAGVRDLLPGEQAQEVRLAAAVAAEHPDALAVEHLEVERLHQPGELELLAGDGAHAGAAAAQAHRHLLVDHLLRRRAPRPGSARSGSASRR
jgi:hypothetical protein